MTTQMAIPVKVDPVEVSRKRTLGEAMMLCAELGGFALDKELQLALNVDKAQFSRWHAGTEGISWAKLQNLMDVCGNDAPLLWMLHQRGFDIASLRIRETELERNNRELKEELVRERSNRAAVEDAMRRILTGANAA